ncbi:MAG: dipeptidase [Ascidiaceihabitans sp.]|nr:dipeptidase [Ascidiaceihabitans sp.]
MTLVFDGHNDALSRLWCGSTDPVADFAKPIGHVNVPDARSGGLAGGFFALFSPTKRQAFDFTKFETGDLDMTLPPAIDGGAALSSAIAQAGLAQRLQNAGHIRICTDAQTLARSFVGPELACILHLEGADCIDPDLLALDALYAMGLRSLGLVWSRPTIFAQGVPFQHGRDGDTGAGLTPLGKTLVARCKELGVMVDTSHLTMAGFWDVAEAGLPLVATHSNAVARCNATRNLTDAQLNAVGETNGMVGLNFGTVFLSDQGWKTGKATIADCLAQLDHMIDQAGEDHVGLGSDFDGAPMPAGIKSAADLPKLCDAMADHGYSDTRIAKIAHENWLSFLSRQL